MNCYVDTLRFRLIHLALKGFRHFFYNDIGLLVSKRNFLEFLRVKSCRCRQMSVSILLCCHLNITLLLSTYLKENHPRRLC